MTKKSKIEIEITLDEDNVPEDISWKASDDPQHRDFESVKGMFLSLFDGEKKNTLKIDLWTKEMQVEEMDKFVFQILSTMTDTYVKATNNKELGGAMQQFVRYFGEKTAVIKKSDNWWQEDSLQ